MGFKASDVSPLQSNNISLTLPGDKTVKIKIFAVARTDTVAVKKMVLPADATILDIAIAGVASDAATTATLSVGTSSSANELVNAQDVKGGGTFIRPTVVGTAVYNLENIPLGADQSIYAKYAETGTASTVGAWRVAVYYVR